MFVKASSCFKRALFVTLYGLLVLCDEGITSNRHCRPEDGYYLCSDSGKCIKRTRVHKECSTENITCNNEEFKCRTRNHCVRRAGIYKEDGCLLKVDKKIILPCRSDEFTCVYSKLCLPRWKVGDGVRDCVTPYTIADATDELQAFKHCYSYEFRCRETGRCIPREWVKDGFGDCFSSSTNSSDEIESLASCDKINEFRCVTSEKCIRRYRVMDNYTDCDDNSDEIQPLSCNLTVEFRCRNNGRCIPRSWRLDGTENCDDGSDETIENYNTTCTADEFRCHNSIRCVSNNYLCDGTNHCGDCSDEVEACRFPAMRRCPSQPSSCILLSSACDSSTNCPLGSDNPTNFPGFKCNVTKPNGISEKCVIPQWSLHDTQAICADKSDICYENGTFQCAYCITNVTKSQIIAKNQICDGVIDCKDLSDECLCMKKVRGDDNNEIDKLCKRMCYSPESGPCKKCVLGEIYCEADDKCINTDKLCNGKFDCPHSQIDEKYCTKVKENVTELVGKDFSCWPVNDSSLKVYFKDETFPVNATKCNGIVECAMFEDECSANCSTTLPVCNDIPLISTSNPYGSSINFRQCKSGEAIIIGSYVCDGVKDCPDQADEKACKERFYCNGGLQTRLGMDRRVVSISEDKKCDGKPDCLDSSDEVDCTNPFSSREEMIRHPVLRYLIWLMASIAVVGNVTVILENYFSWKEFNKSSTEIRNVTMFNRILILNLAVADLLMGITLFIIAINSAIFSGNYSAMDSSWRTSRTCNAIGVLIVISSETTVFTLVVLTLYRLFGVYNPFVTRYLKIRYAIFGCVTTWMLSSLLAFIPIMPKVNKSMIMSVYINHSSYFRFTSVPWKQFEMFTKRLFTIGNRSDYQENYFLDWKSSVYQLQLHYPDYLPKIYGYFGYYSDHGVCIPRLFRIRNAPPLNSLTLLVISINFAALVFIIVAYCFIYHKSNVKIGEGDNSVTERRASVMQRKITILIATDLCCWLPICIITFLSNTVYHISPLAYVVTAIFLLPINSSLNPIIYSNAFAYTREAIVLLATSNARLRLRHTTDTTEMYRVNS